MTWGQFKKALEEKGVTNDMKIEYIDINCGFDTDDLEDASIDINHKNNSFSIV